MQVGLYFGSFNPVHSGHLIIANHVLNETSLQKIWFVVSPQNPFKSHELLNEKQRLSLVKKSIAGDKRFFASNIEFGLPRPSFTVNTLTSLKKKYPNHKFSIVMGSDSFTELHKWKDFELIIKTCKIFIYRRFGFEINNLFNAKIEILNAPFVDISSTEVRRLIKKGKSIRYLVPEKARREIEKKNYYKK